MALTFSRIAFMKEIAAKSWTACWLSTLAIPNKNQSLDSLPFLFRKMHRCRNSDMHVFCITNGEKCEKMDQILAGITKK